MMSLQQTFYLIINLVLYSVINTQILPLLQEYVCFKSCTAIAITVFTTIVSSENQWKFKVQIINNVPSSIKHLKTSLCQHYTKIITPILAYNQEKLKFSSNLFCDTKVTTNICNKETESDVIAKLNPINCSPPSSDDSADELEKHKLQVIEACKVKHDTCKTKNRSGFKGFKKKYEKNTMGQKKSSTNKRCTKGIILFKAVFDVIKSTTDVILERMKTFHRTSADLQARWNKMNDSMMCMQQIVQQNNIRLSDLKELEIQIQILSRSLVQKIDQEKNEIKARFKMFEEKLHELNDVKIQQQKVDAENFKRFIEGEVKLQTFNLEKSISTKVNQLSKKKKKIFQKQDVLIGIQKSGNKSTEKRLRTSDTELHKAVKKLRTAPNKVDGASSCCFKHKTTQLQSPTSQVDETIESNVQNHSFCASSSLKHRYSLGRLKAIL